MVASKTDDYLRDNAKQISESKATSVANKKVEPEFKITHLMRKPDGRRLTLEHR